jgi:undecaprenyl-diphosphatase
LIRALRWLGSRELPTLVCLVLVTAGLWLFAELADEVLEGTTKDLDSAVLLAMRNPDDLSDPLGPRWLEETARDVTALGGIGLLTGLTLAVVGYLALHRRFTTILLILAAVGGGVMASQLLKLVFERARPDLVPHGSYVYTASFPSGHAMVSAATYLTLGALLARLERRRHVKAYLLILSVLLTVVVGCSRVYLGVHWPTDVLAGWTIGACWALICWAIAWRWQRGLSQSRLDRSDS